MSVLINGMEMPKNCGQCPFKKLSSTGESMICELTLFTVPWDWKTTDCPLIPVPPHGRLIDADALMETISKVIGINASIEQRNEAVDQERRCLWWFEQQIGIAPSIIPAKEGET